MRMNGNGEEVQTPTKVIARVETECVFEATVQAEDEESAFCQAYLLAGLVAEEKIVEKTVSRQNDLFTVHITYVVEQRYNL